MTEIKASEELRRRHMVITTALIKRTMGNFHRSDVRGKPMPENTFFEFMATMLPQICFDNPAVSCSAKRVMAHKPVAQFMEMFLNGWIKERDLKTELELLAVDFLFSYACAMVGVEARGDYTSAAGEPTGVEGRFTCDALTPFMVRLSPANVIIDSQCQHWNSARILGHMFQRDLNDLLTDERYDPAIVARLTADEEQPVGAHTSERIIPAKRTNDPTRNRVTLYQLYFPEYRQIGTLCVGAGGVQDWIRPPADYHGPREGPYVFYGCYAIPDQVYPLSPIAAMAEQTIELNAHGAAAAKEASQGKKVILVDANNPDAAAAIENAPTGSVIRIKGLNAQSLIPAEIGGTSPERLQYLQTLLARADRVSGQSDAIRGKAQGVTATEANIADAGADNRTEWIHTKYRDGVKEGLKRVGWYAFYDKSVVSVVSATDPSTGQAREGLFMGGQQAGQENMHWPDFFLDIEPYSMRRVDPALQQQKAMMTVELVTTLVPLIPQFPWVNWPEILDMIGEANNIPDFQKIVLNQLGQNMLAQMSGTMMGMMPGQLGGLTPQSGMGLPPGVNPMITAGLQGAPVKMMGNQMPQLPPAGGGLAGGGGAINRPGMPRQARPGFQPATPTSRPVQG
jgi:hypothetical protein